MRKILLALLPFLFLIFPATGQEVAHYSPDDLGPFRKFDVSRDGRKLLVTTLQREEAILYDVITGKEIMRLKLRGNFIYNVFYDDVRNRYIIDYTDAVEIWDGGFFQVVNTIDKPFNSGPAEFSEVSNRIAFRDPLNFYFLNLETGQLAKRAQPLEQSGPAQPKFDVSGKYAFEINGNGIYRYSVSDYQDILYIPYPNVIQLAAHENSLFIVTSPGGNSAQLEFLDIEGNPTGAVPQPIDNFWRYDFELKAYNDELVSYSGWKMFSLMTAAGYKEEYHFTDAYSGFRIQAGLVFLNFNSNIQVKSLEGNLWNQFSVRRLRYQSQFQVGQQQVFLNEEKLDLGSGNTPQRSVDLPGAYVNQYAKGKQVFAFATRDRKIRVWDVAKGEQVTEITDLPSYPQFLQLMESKKLLLAAYPQLNLITVHDLYSGELLQQLELESSPTAFDVNDTWLLAGNHRGEFATWKFTDRELIPERPFTPMLGAITAVKLLSGSAYVASNGRFMQVPLKKNQPLFDFATIGHSSPIMAMASNGSQIMATSSVDGEIKLWDLSQDLLLQSLQMDSTYLDQLELHQDLLITGNGPGNYGVAFKNKALAKALVDPNPELLIQSSNTQPTGKLVFSPDGELLASVDGKKVKIRDVKTGFLISEFTTRDDLVNDLDFVRDGKSVVLATAKGLEYFDPITGESKKYIDLRQRERSIHAVDISPILNVGVAVNIHNWHEPLFFHTTSGNYLNSLYYNSEKENDHSIRQVEFSPDGKYVSTYGSHYIKLFEVVDQNSVELKQIAAFPRPEGYNKGFHDSFRNYLSFSQDSRYLSYLQFGSPNTTVVYDIVNQKQVVSLPGSLSVFGKEGALFMMDPFQDLQVYDLKTGDILKFQPENEHIDLIYTLAYNNKHNLFASADTWGNIKLWNGENGQAIWEIDRFESDTYNTDLSPDGHYIAYNNKNGIFVFDLEQFRTYRLKGDNYPYFGAFSNDSKLFYYRNGKDYYYYDLEQREEKFLLSTTVPAEEAGGTRISEDGNFLIFENKKNGQLQFYDLRQKALVHSFASEGVGDYIDITAGRINAASDVVITGIGLKKKNDSIMTFQLVDYNLNTGQLDRKTGQKEIFLDHKYNLNAMKQNLKVNTQSPDGRWYAFQEEFHLKIEDLQTNKVIYDREFDYFELMSGTFTSDGKYLVFGLNDGTVTAISTATKEEAFHFQAINGSIESLSTRGRFLLVRGGGEKLKVYDIQDNFANVYTSAFVGDGEFVIASEEGYYYASKGAIESVAFKKGSEVYPFEQFDLFYNRPDKAAEGLVDLGITDPLLAKAFYQAYQKRISRMGIEEDQLSGNFHLPSLSLNTESLPVTVTGSSLEFEVTAQDKTSSLERLLVWINDVPVFGSKGKAIPKGNSLQQTLKVDLQKGQNKVQVAVSNDKGVESLRQTFVVSSVQPEARPSLYLVSIGVSEYQDSNYNLEYAAKDATDLSAFTQSFTGNYEEVKTMTLLNEEVSEEKVRALKQTLMKTTTNDIVIVFFAGHGVLDDKLDYYLATHEMDFENPSEKGLAYEDLEALLDGIPARQKLLLIDACHSGEIDKEDVALAETTQNFSTSDKVVANRGSVVVKSKSQKVGLENSFELMKLLFADLRRGTGAMVISSASGMEYAYEGSDWKNGVFTYALLNGLKSRTADINNDGTIKVSEIREYVIEKVQELTDGKQNPTSRKVNLEFDFQVW